MKRKPTDSEPLTTNRAHYTSSIDAIRKIVEDEGITGLYSGINGSLIGVASTNFAYFYWYSVVRSLYLSSQAIPKPPGTAAELSLGAAAGAVAQVFTIPVSVITTRQQTQPKGDKRGLLGTGREVVHSEDGWSGLWRGLKASLVLVANPAITYSAYQRLRQLLFSGKANLRPWESFCESARYWQHLMYDYLFSYSSRCCVQSAGDDSHAAVDSCQSRPSVSPTTSKARQTFQKLPRGHVLHHRARGTFGAFQRPCPPNHKGYPRARVADDDQGKVRHSPLQDFRSKLHLTLAT